MKNFSQVLGPTMAQLMKGFYFVISHQTVIFILFGYSTFNTTQHFLNNCIILNSVILFTCSLIYSLLIEKLAQ